MQAMPIAPPKMALTALLVISAFVSPELSAPMTTITTIRISIPDTAATTIPDRPLTASFVSWTACICM
jgi:hypothetical protein